MSAHDFKLSRLLNVAGTVLKQAPRYRYSLCPSLHWSVATAFLKVCHRPCWCVPSSMKEPWIVHLMWSS